jgi:hypothetical protein
VTALIPSIMERTLLFNFPASLRDVRNWQHSGDVAISAANVHFAPLPDLATFSDTLQIPRCCTDGD